MSEIHVRLVHTEIDYKLVLASPLREDSYESTLAALFGKGESDAWVGKNPM